MLAVLWARVPEAALSHETALDAYGISDVNPNRIHLTVDKAKGGRLGWLVASSVKVTRGRSPRTD